ncbi:M20 metallopeptidase family protein [Clostridium folliculivorans]|uniref:Hydrolase n=1 Tax=Clostridium folliculivorans TaxID=2886038 RepID=A0A9W5XZI1_9CLOT|nr:M20 family metallopeptidase [Clostridium folliculivorans]GKU23800.1 hydrolase [Clostridium folliculivorans]GKU29916.1 hydrolase [Clostridium folliculivorans]
MDIIKKVVQENLDEVISMWHKLHATPELSFEEYKTQELLLEFLNSMGYESKKIAKTGLVAVLGDDSKAIGIRTDIDAINVAGPRHSCGHDFHMSTVLGTALVLKKLGVKKTVKFLFQPAEEAIGGAKVMIEEGVLKNPEVTEMIGFHVWPKVPVGTIEVSPGPSMASVDDFIITFKGKGGHAAMPYICINPLYPAMDFINTMTIKTKIENNPLDPHILTFTTLQCGTVGNVIAEESVVKGTVRTFDMAFKKKLQNQILAEAEDIGKKYNCSVSSHYNVYYPPVISDEALTEKFTKISKKALGENNVRPLEKTFTAEDFSFYCEKVPSVHFRLGISDGSKGESPLHSPNFDGSFEALYYGIYTLVNYVLNA